MMVRLDISGGDTMFFLVRLDFFFYCSNAVLKQDRGCEWEPEFLEYGTNRFEGKCYLWAKILLLLTSNQTK